MGGFSFSQFRTLLAAFRHGEEHDDPEGTDLWGSSSSKLSPVAKRVVTGVLLVVLCLVLFMVGGLLSSSDLNIVQVFSMMVGMLVVMVVLVGFYQAVNMLYFVKDMGFYLALPIHPLTIMAAKMVYFILTQVIVNFIIMAFGLGFLVGRGADAAALAGLVLAFIPCVMATALALIIVVIPVMRFSPIAADKDRFTRVFGAMATVVSIVIAAAVSMGTNSSSGMMVSMGDVVGNEAVAVVLALVCAPVVLAPQVFGGSMAFGLVGMYLLALLYVAVMGLFAKKWYFEGVRGIQGGAGKKSRKRYSEGELAGAVKERSQFKAFLSQDFATLMRVPAFFQQFVVSVLVEPIAVVFASAVLISIQDDDVFNTLQQLVQSASIGANTHLLLIGIALLAGLFSCLPAYMCSYALGRDGEDFFFMRAMPMDMKQYVVAKFVSGYLVTRVPVFVLLLVGLIVLGTPLDAALLAVLAFALPLTVVDLVMFGIGSRKPNLTWENESELLKPANMQLKMLITAGLGLVAFAFPAGTVAAFAMLGVSGYLGAAAMLLVCVAECAGVAAYVLNVAPENMELVRR